LWQRDPFFFYSGPFGAVFSGYRNFGSASMMNAISKKDGFTSIYLRV